MSSRAGGIADDGSGGSCAYRASEAALNCIGESRAVVLEEQGRRGRRDASWSCQDWAGYEREEAAGKLWKVCYGAGDRGDWEVLASRGDGVGLVEWSPRLA